MWMYTTLTSQNIQAIEAVYGSISREPIFYKGEPIGEILYVSEANEYLENKLSDIILTTSLNPSISCKEKSKKELFMSLFNSMKEENEKSDKNELCPVSHFINWSNGVFFLSERNDDIIYDSRENIKHFMKCYENRLKEIENNKKHEFTEKLKAAKDSKEAFLEVLKDAITGFTDINKELISSIIIDVEYSHKDEQVEYSSNYRWKCFDAIEADEEEMEANNLEK